MKILVVTCGFILFFISCDKKNEHSETSEYLEWYLQLVENEEEFRSSDLLLNDNILFIPMSVGPSPRRAVLKAVDINSKEVLWTWDEHYVEYGANSFCKSGYTYQNIVCICSNNVISAVDINTGKTVWHNRNEYSGLIGIRGYKEHIFRQTKSDNNDRLGIEYANIKTGNWEELIVYEKKDSFFLYGSTVTPFERNGEVYITFIHSKLTTGPNRVYFSWLNLYNINQRKMVWTSDTIRGESGFPFATPGLIPTIDGEMVSFGDRSIFTYNLLTGEKIWDKYYGNSFALFSNLTAYEGNVYGNNESLFMVGHEMKTGMRLFNVETGGTASKIVADDGKLYLSAVTTSGPNRLIVLDSHSGKLLFEVEAQFLDEESKPNLFFDRVIEIEKNTKNIYTTDHKHLLTFKFN